MKFGECPNNPKSPFERMCWDICHGLDYNCPGVQKCCPHNCGWSCQEPDGLEDLNSKYTDYAIIVILFYYSIIPFLF